MNMAATKIAKHVPDKAGRKGLLGRKVGMTQIFDATGAVVRHVIPVLDHFDLALAQDPARMTVAAAVDGIRMVRTELIKALERSGVELIQPQQGDAFDPHQAEAIMHRPADGIASGCVSMTLQPGYRLGETVLRPAKVAVAP